LASMDVRRHTDLPGGARRKAGDDAA